MSEAEARFDARRRAFGRWLGPILATSMLLAPLELPNDAHRLSAICVLVVIWWVTEAIPLAVTAVVAVAAVVADLKPPMAVRPAKKRPAKLERRATRTDKVRCE